MSIYVQDFAKNFIFDFSSETLVKQLKQFDSKMNLLEKWKAASAEKKDAINQLLSGSNLDHNDVAKAETLFRVYISILFFLLPLV